MAAKQTAARRKLDQPTGVLDTVEGGSEALELDRLIHERVRLGIVSSLAVNGSLTFTDLRDLLGITDGNLKSHASKLEDAGYITRSKSFKGRTQKTEYELTATGRNELESYLGHMEAIIQATRHSSER
jgi:DNA-binding MarR family transcriptional regulator